jgi:DNA helicase-2/ATP-dependent DNA helicase PcrA
VGAVEACVRALGYDEGAEAQGDEATRQADLQRLLHLSREYPGDGGVAGFLADLEQRFAREVEGRGVQLLTYHRAKGLEFDAVFLPRLEERELPFVYARSPEAVEEERRLFYVGITRARRHLFLSWAWERPGERRRRCSPSPFLAEIRPRTGPGAAAPPPRARPDRSPAAEEGGPLFEALKAWRRDRARDGAVPAYVVFADRTLAEIARVRPAGPAELLGVHGVGPSKIARYGEEVLALVRSHPPEDAP